MKRLTTGLLAGVLLASSLPALADSYGSRHERYFERDRYARHERPEYRHHDEHGGAILGVLGAGLVLGAIALAAEPPHRPPPPVVVMPARAPAGTWYYCNSAGTYYPYTEYCPEGWRAVPATPY